MRRCTFVDNRRVNGIGGAVAAVNYSTVVIEDCSFIGNSSNLGGAIATSGSAPQYATLSTIVRGCSFISNGTTGAGKGGAIHAGGQPLITVEGNTFHNNSQPLDWPNGGSSVVLAGDTNIFRLNVVSSSLGDQAVSRQMGTVVTGCNVYWNNPLGNTSGFSLDPTDVVADPLFCGPETGHFTVNEGSPCLPPNNPCRELIGAWGKGCGTVSVESRSWGSIKGIFRVSPEEVAP
jgi:predicted outer membrane repeat protein